LFFLWFNVQALVCAVHPSNLKVNIALYLPFFRLPLPFSAWSVFLSGRSSPNFAARFSISRGDEARE
jgi:hypothetical protein